VWEHGIQVGIATVISRSSQYIPRITPKEVFEGTVDVVLLDVAPLKADLLYPEHPVKILDQKDVSHGAKLSSFSKCSGVTTLRREPLGRVKISSVRTIRISFCRSRVCATVRYPC
jgi:hypothetical protein